MKTVIKRLLGIILLILAFAFLLTIITDLSGSIYSLGKQYWIAIKLILTFIGIVLIVGLFIFLIDYLFSSDD